MYVDVYRIQARDRFGRETVQGMRREGFDINIDIETYLPRERMEGSQPDRKAGERVCLLIASIIL